ncbi:DUF5005 domain-containing protein [Actinoplanes sp. KI2]|uniref:DUF5005 domain-containing protein n=1 Tax=Actinoplanes sp. KI2 TaxID=2983315 RepID=UPI0021D5C9AD|nr:DUF5005 domain-containing protein [Actinoplanes sp. KI2]MCU7724444.1 DUF5005 domain-containing protein [Actinoplanes sp. KI2]
MRARYWVTAVMAGCLALGLLALARSGAKAPASAPSTTAPPAAPRFAAADLTAMFQRYADGGGGWTGGDNTASVALPDGRVAWLFSDTYLGNVAADHTRPRDSPFVHNTIVVQEGATLTRTLHGGPEAGPKPLVGPAGDDYYWAQTGVVAGGALQVFYNRYHRHGAGPWDFTLTGSALATFALPGLRLKNVTDLPLGDTIAWGAAVLQEGEYTYVYGSERTGDALRFAHLARARDPAAAWEFWDGTGWTARAQRSARLLSGVDTGFSVQRAGDRYVLVTTEGNLPFDPAIVAYTSATPAGPWAGPVQLHTPEEPLAYDARLHPELARPGRLLISYNVNSLDADTAYRDARVYRPRFVEVAWPPRPAAGTAPAGLVAAVNDVHPRLRWKAVPGATRYWVYERDLTIGQTHPARRPEPVTGTEADAGQLKEGHTYEFRVAADDSELSAAVTATRTRPQVPSGLRARALSSGRIALTWDDPGAHLWYWLYQRDAGSGGPWRRADYPIDDPGGFTTVPLLHGHAYEFRITAIGPAGESGPSRTVRVTARYAAPPAPTGLTVVPGDGRADLTWRGNAPYYRMYYRDVTAGQTAYTRGAFLLDEPKAAAGLLTNGHVYDFRVTAVRNGAEGPPSRSVRVTLPAPSPSVTPSR